MDVIPEGEWLCDPCAAQVDPKATRCLLCPSKGGALKQASGGGWVHVACVMWTPEVLFADSETMSCAEAVR